MRGRRLRGVYGQEEKEEEAKRKEAKAVDGVVRRRVFDEHVVPSRDGQDNGVVWVDGGDA